ncbi:MAG: adenylate/guanylate cyclase domain-containing protein, partial [Cyanobacteriota bacterium]
YAIISVLAVLIISYIMGLYLFTSLSIIMSLGTSTAIVLISIPVVYAFKYIKENREKRIVERDKITLMNLFDRYVSPDVAELIWSNKDKIKLSGEKLKATVLFSDIRGFTTISENSDPEDLLKMLNEYFEDMAKIIYENNGNLNKFIGDGLMVLYGVPLSAGSIEQDAYNAISSSIKMLDAVTKLNKKWKNKYKEIKIGVGIHTGELIVGNIGSSKRMEYSALGDTVNLSSRLEGLNKEFDTRIIVSEDTYDIVKDKFNFKYLASKKVKGREKEVNIYTIEQKKEEKNENKS